MESMHTIHSTLNLDQKDSFYIHAVVHLLDLEHVITKVFLKGSWHFSP